MLLLILAVGFNVLYHEKAIKEIDSKISIVTSAVIYHSPCREDFRAGYPGYP